MCKVKYGVYLSGEFAKVYRTDNDCVRLSRDEAFELISSYVGLEATFNVCDWFGGCTSIKFTITGVEVNPYRAIITVESNKNCPDRFFPTVYEICKKNDVLGPISVSIIY